MSEEERPEEANEVAEGEVLTGDIETLRQALVEEGTKTERYLANWQRAQADFMNYKKRVEQEKNEVTDFANAALILNLLPVVDDLERAFASLPSKLQTLSWVDGIRLIYRKLQAILETHGVVEIKTKGENFDPKFHEAAMYEDGAEEGVIMDELQKGYKLKGRLLRPAVVVVGKGKEEEQIKTEPS